VNFDVKIINPKNENLSITLYLKQNFDLGFQASLDDIILDLDQVEGYTTCGEKIWPYFNGHCCQDGSVAVNEASCGQPNPIQLNIEPFSNTTISLIYTTIVSPSVGFETGEPLILGTNVFSGEEITAIEPEDYGLILSPQQVQLPPGATPISGPGWVGVQIGNKIGIVVNGQMVFFEKDPIDGNLYKLDPVTEEREVDGQGNPIALNPNNPLERLPPPPEQKQKPKGVLLGKKGKDGRKTVCELDADVEGALENINEQYNNCLNGGGNPKLIITVSQPNFPNDKILDDKKTKIIIDAAKKQAGDKKDVFYKLLKTKLLNLLKTSKDPAAELYMEVDCGGQQQKIKVMEAISPVGNCVCDRSYFSPQGLIGNCAEDC
jgi:hypothetical protein